MEQDKNTSQNLQNVNASYAETSSKPALKTPDSEAGQLKSDSPLIERSDTTDALGFDLKPGWYILPAEELPLPSYWPVVMALGITLLCFGIISSTLIIIAGIILFVVSIYGWIGDLQNEQGHGHSH